MFEIYKNVYTDVREGFFEKTDAYEPISLADRIELPKYVLKVLEDTGTDFAENLFDFDWVEVIPTKDCYYVEIFIHKYTLEEIKQIMTGLNYDVYGYVHDNGCMYYCVKCKITNN